MRTSSRQLLTIAVSLLVGLGASAAHADTVVQVSLPGVLDARSVTTLTDGQLVIFTLPTDGGNLQNAFATQAVATLKGKPVINALPDDGKFPANARHPEVVLNFSNAAAATSAQTHLIPPSGKIMFPVPLAVYSKFFLFFNGAAGGTTVKVTLTYTDGTSIANATIPDYYNAPTDPAVFDLAPDLAKWDKNTVINEADHHSINGVEVLPTAGKTLTNVQVERGAEGNLVFWGATGIATTDIAIGGAGGGAGAAGAAGSAGVAGAGGAAGGGAGGQSTGAGAGGSSAGTTSGAGGAATAGSATTPSAGAFTNPGAPTEDTGCSCRVVSEQRAPSSSAAWLALAALTLVGRRSVRSRSTAVGESAS